MFNILTVLPEKNSPKWKDIFISSFIAILFVIVSVLLVFNPINFNDITFMEDIIALLLLAIIPSGILSLSGYLGAKFTPLTTGIGTLIGFGFMVNFISKGHKLSALVGGIAFLDVVVISVIIGLVVDLIYYYFYKKHQ